MTRVRQRLFLREVGETAALGRCLARIAVRGDVLLLSGELGAGKTTLTKALATGLGIDEREVTSPSFSIIHEHNQGRLPLIHVDLYRLGPNSDFGETGLEDYLDGTNLVVIEWADHLKDRVVIEGLTLHLRWVDEGTREADLEGAAAVWEGRLRILNNCIKEIMNNDRERGQHP